MRKKRILLLVPIVLIACSIMYSWYVLLSEAYIPHWKHYMALAALLPVLYFYFRKDDFNPALIATGLYLILGIISVLSLEPGVQTSSFSIHIGITISTPSINWYSFLLFIVYIACNFDNLVNMYYDYKESKGKL